MQTKAQILMPSTPTQSKRSKPNGVTGTTIYGGIITGEEYNARLQGANAIRMYDIMSRSDADVHGALEVCKQPVIAADWHVQAAKTPKGKVDPKDQEIADHISYELFKANLDFDDVLYQALDMLDFGFSLFELLIETHNYNGKLVYGIKDISFRKQTTIRKWEMENGKPGVHQQTTLGTYDIPFENLVLFTNKRRGDNYEGISLLRYIYKDWDIKDKLTLVNAMALEQLAKGVPLIKEDPDYNGQVNATDMDKAEEALLEFRVNDKGYIKTPKGLIVEMMDMKSNTTKDVLPTIAMHRRSIYTSVLATFLDLGGSSGSGSQSLSKDLTSLFLKSEEYIAKTLRSVWNNQVIKRICDLNYSELPNGYPQLMNGNIADDDITALATAMQSFAGANLITPDAEMEDIIRAKVGMNPMPEKLKNEYDARHAIPDTTISKDTNTPVAKAVPKDGKKPELKDTKKNAAVNAANDATRKMIEVIFADED